MMIFTAVMMILWSCLTYYLDARLKRDMFPINVAGLAIMASGYALYVF
jgi:hypothetical protein